MVHTYSLYIGMSSSCGKCLRKISTNADSFSSMTSVLSGSLPYKYNQHFPNDGSHQYSHSNQDGGRLVKSTCSLVQLSIQLDSGVS